MYVMGCVRYIHVCHRLRHFGGQKEAQLTAEVDLLPTEKQQQQQQRQTQRPPISMLFEVSCSTWYVTIYFLLRCRTLVLGFEYAI